MSAAISVFPSAASRASAAASRFSTVPRPTPAASSRSAFRMPKQSPLPNRILNSTLSPSRPGWIVNGLDED